MFEITGADIKDLGDVDLRTLVARLCLAELHRQGLPLSGVTAGGHQNAPDGGLDVRVEVTKSLPQADFVPRPITGFQVKKPDMRASAIIDEMKPNGVLRKAIGELAERSGAYVVVSAQGSVADEPLKARRKAMRDALDTHPRADKLHTDFYDRDRLATWVNGFPGAAAWVRARVGRELSGWRPIGNWTDDTVAEATPYLCGDTACLIDERSSDRRRLTVAEGIEALRSSLSRPRQAVRLIGLSGLGKTRLVQALFETGVGTSPLDPALAIYADYSEETTPSAREMARRLVGIDQRAILVVDNCNPETHAELARICGGNHGQVSLITVEYDVRDDEPERTEVFRLESASPGLVEEWLKQSFAHLSAIDRSRIASFSDGNFRVARALAETLKRGETLGQLRNRELFQRIFRQRNDDDQQLLRAAEELSLLYSFDGEDSGPSGELAHIASIRSVLSSDLYAATVQLRRRGVVQARGRWRAVLPHAIANPLAAYALERIPADGFDLFCARLPERMILSLSRRLGFLHDSADAQRVVARWLEPGGPLGNILGRGEPGLQILRNIAPVSPDLVLERIEAELTGAKADTILDPRASGRSQWIALLKSLAYDTALFERAAFALARFVAAEPADHNHNSATTAFGELFHLKLSGTQASPTQRRDMIRRLSRGEATGLKRCAALALDELLEADQFTSVSHHDFGARPRDFGWKPRINKDVYDWYKDAIQLAVEVSNTIDNAGTILARNVRQLWRLPGSREALEQAAAYFSSTESWIDGWLNFRAARRFDGSGMPDEVRAQLLSIIDRLAPVDLLSKARAAVLTRDRGGYDLIDSEPGDVRTSWQRAADHAVDLGKAFAADPLLLEEFLPELFAERSPLRAAEFGKGLAIGSEQLEATWELLCAAFEAATKDARNPTVLGGFLAAASNRQSELVAAILDKAVENPKLRDFLPFLQAQAGLDETGVRRLIEAIETNNLHVNGLQSLVSGVVGDAPADMLAILILKIATLKEGVPLAIDIFSARILSDHDGRVAIDPALITCGRTLLQHARFDHKSGLGSFALTAVVETCLAGPDGEEEARRVCRRLRADLDAYRVSSFATGDVVAALFATQPTVALDELLLGGDGSDGGDYIEARLGRPSAVEAVETATLRAWADIEPHRRYEALGHTLSLFATRDWDEDAGLSQMFLELLEHSPDPAAFLGDPYDRIHPRGWSGSLAAALERRRAMLEPLAEHGKPEIRDWAREQDRWLGERIAAEIKRESTREESFE